MMDPKTKPGSLIRFAHQAGSSYVQPLCGDILIQGNLYVLKGILCDASVCDISLEEFPDQIFSSAHFENHPQKKEDDSDAKTTNSPQPSFTQQAIHDMDAAIEAGKYDALNRKGEGTRSRQIGALLDIVANVCQELQAQILAVDLAVCDLERCLPKEKEDDSGPKITSGDETDFSAALLGMKRGESWTRDAFGDVCYVRTSPANDRNTEPYLQMVKYREGMMDPKNFVNPKVFPVELSCESIFATDWHQL